MPKSIENHTAILFFANSSKEEMVQKPLAKKSLFFDVLNDLTLRKVKKTQLPYFHFSEAEQQGYSFGERFGNAIQAIFKKGYHNVIAIGNDSPQLRTSHILEAQKLLENGNTVLGPSMDGGFYLLGLHRDNFDQATFKNLKWQSATTLKDIKAYFRAFSSDIISLQTLFDIDHINDLKRILGFHKTVSLHVRKLISEILLLKPCFYKRTREHYFNFFFHPFFNKGSPGQTLL